MNKNLAFLFPGQGSQSKGMLTELITDEAVVAAVFQEASDILGYDMQALVIEDADEKLNHTEYTQPALLTASTALYRLWLSRDGAMPAQLAGHSLGEYSALVAASSMSFADAVSLVAFRGRVMSEAVPAGVGKMAAIIGLDDGVVSDLCASVSKESGQVWPANFNCPGQLVVAGNAAAVEGLMLAAKDAGAKRALPLAVSAPSHTPLMQPAADAMQERLAALTVNDPSCPVWSNARAEVLTNADSVRKALVEQLISPVRWTEIVQKMTDINMAVEMGPGKVLAGLVRRINREVSVSSCFKSTLMDEAIAVCAEERVDG